MRWLAAHINAVIDAAALAYVSEHLDERQLDTLRTVASSYRCSACGVLVTIERAHEHASTHDFHAEFTAVQ